MAAAAKLTAEALFSISKQKAVKLGTAALGALSQRVAVPQYDRSALSAGIVHFGASNFHRAHQATYLDDLFNLGIDHDWAIVGAGVMQSEKAMRAKLAAQDYLSTVVEQDANVNTVRVTGPMIDFLPIGETSTLISRLTDPRVRIVSLTITEGGYFLNSATGSFDPSHPAIVADSTNAHQPRTVFGLMLAALKQRRAAGTAPFTVLSCDNIPHNGAVTRNAVVGLAALSDAAFAEWVAEKVAFPNGMVDRITPATGDRERQMCSETHGIDDGWPVFCETFRQWVLEDNFPSGRPALERVGVQFVSDVAPYEKMKLRILNGGHASIAYLSALLGHQFTHKAMSDPLVRDFLRKVEEEEVCSTVPSLPGTSPLQYFDVVEQRFSNPKVGDTIRRLCFDGANRQPKFIIPSIADRLSKGQSVDGLALVSALWCRYCYGVGEDGAPIEANDASWERLQTQANKARAEPRAWLAMEDIYGDLAHSDAFVAAFSNALESVWRDGVETAVRNYVRPADFSQAVQPYLRSLLPELETTLHRWAPKVMPMPIPVAVEAQ